MPQNAQNPADLFERIDLIEPSRTAKVARCLFDAAAITAGVWLVTLGMTHFPEITAPAFFALAFAVSWTERL